MNEILDPAFTKYAVGQPVPRSEDPKLLRGEGTYTDDVAAPGAAQAYLLRSPHAHGTITRLDTTTAAAAPKVLAILTSDDIDQAGYGTMPCPAAQTMKGRDGNLLIAPAYYPLAKGQVHYLGQPVALVVAETLAAAREAAELIELDIDPLAAVTDAREAIADGAPQLHAEAPNNLAIDWEAGDEAEVDRIYAAAHHVTKLTLRNSRLVVSAMEPRACLADYDPASERYTLNVASQGVFGFTGNLATRILNVPREKLHVLTGNVGGSFGMKSNPYPDYVAVLAAARKLARAVQWRDVRTDSFLSDTHGRDAWAEASLAFDANGKILAGRVISHANVGAYLGPVGPNPQTGNIFKNFPSVYNLPAFHVRTFAVFTNTTPIGPYRGAGRPEGVYYMERVIDAAARELGIDSIELRRRNMITPDQMPIKAVSGLTYDSGDFPAILDQTLEQADWDGFEARRLDSAKRGLLRGRGIGSYLEVTAPSSKEMGRLRFDDDGSVTMVHGSLDYGQGHATPFAQVVSQKLGIPFERLKLLQGDSDQLIAGSGTGGSRSAISGSALLLKAADLVIENGRRLAGHMLEASAEDIEFENGRFRIAGTDRDIDIMELARQTREMSANGTIPDDLPQALDAELADDTPPSSFPNGCHVAEIEIDPETGAAKLARFIVVDDFGTLINPLLVEGQVHGGVVQGQGQILMEDVVYDSEGQLLSGSYMDYAVPRAADVPSEFTFTSHPVPATTNPLGVKGCGEAGTTGALPAIMNAIVDVLAREAGVTNIDMPATPEKIWLALNQKG